MRNSQIVIKILKVVSKFTDYDKEKDITKDKTLEGIKKKEIYYHVMLLKESEYLKAKSISGFDKEDYVCHPIRLTFRGYDFIDKVKQAEKWGYWDLAVKTVSGATGIGTLETLYEILKKHSIERGGK